MRAFLGERAEAASGNREAIRLLEQLADDFPNVPEYGLGLGGAYCNFGILMHESGQPEAALSWFQKAIARLEAVLAREPRLVQAREFLCNSHSGRAHALDDLGRHAEAIRDWERALELDYGHDKEFLRSHLAESRLRRSRKEKDAAGCLAAICIVAQSAGSFALTYKSGRLFAPGMMKPPRFKPGT